MHVCGWPDSLIYVLYSSLCHIYQSFQLWLAKLLSHSYSAYSYIPVIQYSQHDYCMVANGVQSHVARPLFSVCLFLPPQRQWKNMSGNARLSGVKSPQLMFIIVICVGEPKVQQFYNNHNVSGGSYSQLQNCGWVQVTS